MKRRMISHMAAVALAAVVLGGLTSLGANAATGGAEQVAAPSMHVYYAIAIVVGVACISAGYAVGKVGAAALGAASENPEIMGRALVFVVVAEGIAIYGLIVGVMLIPR